MNKELILEYKNADSNRRKEIKKKLLSRYHRKCRVKSGNTDLVLSLIPKQSNEDIIAVVMVSGVYSITEIKNMNLTIPRDKEGKITWL